jgi:hypothetical protein
MSYNQHTGAKLKTKESNENLRKGWDTIDWSIKAEKPSEPTSSNEEVLSTPEDEQSTPA